MIELKVMQKLVHATIFNCYTEQSSEISQICPNFFVEQSQQTKEKCLLCHSIGLPSCLKKVPANDINYYLYT